MPGVRLIQLKPRCSWGLSSNYKRDKVGIQSIRRLEEAGIESIKDLALLRTEDLVKLGVQRKIAEQVRGYIQRRVQ